MTGTTWVEESGFLEGPVMITNTHSVGVVRDAVIQWRVAHGQTRSDRLLVVAAGRRGNLGRLAQRHQWLPRKTRNTRFHAIDTAHDGYVEEGGVGGGTGMICNEFKGRHRQLFAQVGRQGWRLHCRCPRPVQLRESVPISVSLEFPVGKEISEDPAYAAAPFEEVDRGSIIVVVATDAPLLSHQLKTAGSPRFAWTRPQRQHFRQRLRRHFCRLLHRQSAF